MDVRLPNGQIVKNVPEGTTKRQLTEKLVRNEVISQREANQMMMSAQKPQDELSPREQLDQSLSGGERFLIGLGRGATDVLEGVQQIGLQAGEAVGLVDEGRAEEFTQEAQRERELYSQGDLGVLGGAGRLTGNVAATAVPAGAALKATGAGRALAGATQGSRAGRIGANTGAGVAGGATQFVEEGGSRAQNAALGGVFGAVGGEVLERLGRRLASIPKRLGRNATRGRRFAAVRQEMQGEVPNDILDDVANDVADGLTPEQALRKAEIERLGATPTRGRVTDDIDDLRFEQEQSRFAGPLADIESQNRAAISESARRRASDMAGGRETAPFAAGTQTRETLETGRAAAKRQEGQAFDAAGEKLAELGDDVRVQPNRLGEVIGEEQDFLIEDMPAAFRRLRRIGLVDGEGNIIPGATISAKEAEGARRLIGRFSESNDPNVRRVAGKLRGALDDDVVRDVGEDVFAPARQVSAERFARFDNRDKVDAVLKGKIPPERIPETVTQKRFSIKDTQEFFDTLDSVDPQAGQQARGAVLENVFGSLEGNAFDANNVRSITPATFRRRLETIGRDKLNAIFGKEQTESLFELANTSARILGTDKRIQNPGTAAEMSNRFQQALSAVVEFVPGGRFLIGLGRAAKDGAKSREAERQIRRAINLELLKRENVLSEVLGSPSAAPATAVAAGSQPAILAAE